MQYFNGYDAIHYWLACKFNPKGTSLALHLKQDSVCCSISEVKRWLIAAWQWRVWMREIGLNEEFTVQCTHPASANPTFTSCPTPILLFSHQSMQHKPLCMQLARQTGWKWLQFSALIAFCRESRALQLDRTSWHTKTYQQYLCKHTSTQMNALTQQCWHTQKISSATDSQLCPSVSGPHFSALKLHSLLVTSINSRDVFWTFWTYH